MKKDDVLILAAVWAVLVLAVWGAFQLPWWAPILLVTPALLAIVVAEVADARGRFGDLIRLGDEVGDDDLVR